MINESYLWEVKFRYDTLSNPELRYCEIKVVAATKEDAMIESNYYVVNKEDEPITYFEIEEVNQIGEVIVSDNI